MLVRRHDTSELAIGVAGQAHTLQRLSAQLGDVDIALRIRGIELGHSAANFRACTLFAITSLRRRQSIAA